MSATCPGSESRLSTMRPPGAHGRLVLDRPSTTESLCFRNLTMAQGFLMDECGSAALRAMREQRISKGGWRRATDLDILQTWARLRSARKLGSLLQIAPGHISDVKNTSDEGGGTWHGRLIPRPSRARTSISTLITGR